MPIVTDTKLNLFAEALLKFSPFYKVSKCTLAAIVVSYRSGSPNAIDSFVKLTHIILFQTVSRLTLLVFYLAVNYLLIFSRFLAFFSLWFYVSTGTWHALLNTPVVHELLTPTDG